MKTYKDNTADKLRIREIAEEKHRDNISKSYTQLSQTEALKMVHELEVHQIELELMNEELQFARTIAEQAEQKFTELFDFAPLAYFTLSDQGAIVELNLNAARLLMKTRSELIGAKLGFYISEDTKDKFNKFLENIFRNYDKGYCEVTFLIQDNVRMIVFLEGVLTENHEHCLLMVTDITKRKQVEQYNELGREILLVLNEEGYMRGSVQRLLELIKKRMGFDVVGIRMEKNGDYPFYAQIGLTEEFLKTENSLWGHDENGEISRDAVGNYCLECTCGLVISGFNDPNYPLLTPGGSFWTNDFPSVLGKLANDDPRNKPRNLCVYKGFYSMALIPVRGNKGIIGLIHLSDRDKGRFSQEIVEIFERIALNISASLIRLQADHDIKQKNRQLQRINNTKDKFFSIIAHDLRNPFASMVSASEMLYINVDHYDRKLIKSLAKIINDSSKSGLNMLTNLLQWARAQTGSIVFNPKKIKLLDFIKLNLHDLNEMASAKVIQLHYDLNADIELWADDNMLASILRNLITNAIKFTPFEGSVTVSVKQENSSKVIYIKDTGRGIPKSAFVNLFKSDVRYTRHGTNQEDGTGLGLLLCKEFVGKHGGKIWLESEERVGTTFYFSIPDRVKE